MSARFGYTNNIFRSTFLDPASAFGSLDNSPHRTLRESLYGNGAVPNTVDLVTNFPNWGDSIAVLMGGQTPELVAALNQDIAAGIQQFSAAGDEVHVWCIRRNVLAHNETIALVMPCWNFFQPPFQGGAYVTDPGKISGLLELVFVAALCA